MNEGLAWPQLLHCFAQPVGIGRASVQNWNTNIAERFSDGWWFDEFRSEIYVVGELFLDFRPKQSPPHNQVGCNGVSSGFATKQSNQMPHRARVEQKRKENQPAPDGQGAVCTLSEDAMPAPEMSDPCGQEIQSEPAHKDEPTTLCKSDSGQNQTQNDQKDRVLHSGDRFRRGTLMPYDERTVECFRA